MWLKIYVTALVLFPLSQIFAEPQADSKADSAAHVLYRNAYENERLSPKERIEAAFQHYALWDSDTGSKSTRAKRIGRPKIDELIARFLKSKDKQTKIAALVRLPFSPQGLESHWEQIFNLTNDPNLEVRLAAYPIFGYVAFGDETLYLSNPGFPLNRLAEKFVQEKRSIRARREIVWSMSMLLDSYRNDSRIEKALSTPAVLEPVERLVQQAIAVNDSEVSGGAASIIEDNSFYVSQPFIERLLDTLLNSNLADTPRIYAGRAIANILDQARIRDASVQKIVVDVLGRRENDIWDLFTYSPELKKIGLNLAKYMIRYNHVADATAAINRLVAYAIADETSPEHRLQAIDLMARVPIRSDQPPPSALIDYLDHPHFLKLADRPEYRVLLIDKIVEHVLVECASKPKPERNIERWFEHKLLDMLYDADFRKSQVAKNILTDQYTPSYFLTELIANIFRTVPSSFQHVRNHAEDLLILRNEKGAARPQILEMLKPENTNVSEDIGHLF